MTSPVVGSARVEIIGDLGGFASKAEADIRSALNGVGSTAQSTLGGQTSLYEHAGKTAGESYGTALDSASKSKLTQGIEQNAKTAEAEGVSRYERLGQSLGTAVSRELSSSVSSGRGSLARAIESEASMAEAESASKMRQLGEKSGEKFNEGLKENVKGAAGAIFAGVGIVGFGAVAEKGLEAADELEGANIKIEHIFGESAKSVQDWAAKLGSTYGISQQQAEATVGAYAQIFQPLGLSAEQAANMSEKLVTLTSDVAHFNNADPASVQQALISGLRGRATALRQYGIDISNSSIAQEAARLGLIKVGGTMTDAIKTQAAYSLILQQTRKQEGATTDSSATLAQKKRVLTAEMTNLEAKIGTGLLPILTKLAGYLINDVVPALTTAGHWIQQNEGWLKPLVITLGVAYAAYKLTTTGVTAYQKASEAIGKAITGVTSLLGLNTASTEAAAASTAALGAAQDEAVVSTEAATVATTELDTAMDANPIGLVVAAIAALAVGIYLAYKHIGPFRDAIEYLWKGLQYLWKNVLAPIVDFFVKHWKLALEIAVAIVAPFIALPYIIYKKWSAIIGWFAGIWRDVKNGVSSLISGVFNFFASIPGKIIGLHKFFLSAGLSLASSLWDGVKTIVSKVADLGKSMYNAVAGTINRDLIDKIKNWHFTVGAFGIHHTFQPFGSIPELPTFAKGGDLKLGWNLVGEEGAEAVFNSGAKQTVYPAGQTSHMGMDGQPSSGGLTDEDREMIWAAINRPIILTTKSNTIIAEMNNDGQRELARR